MQPKTAVINGTPLTYVEAGAGVPVVFVHGSLADYRTWKAQLLPFSERFHVFAYSRRFHYPKTWSPDDEDYAVETHAADLSAFIQQHCPESAHLVCASWGGNVALTFAVREPARVRSLVLCEPPALPLLEHDTQSRALLEAFYRTVIGPTREALLHDEEDRGLEFFIDGVMGNGAYRSMHEGVRSYFIQNLPAFKGELLSRRYLHAFPHKQIHSIAHPVLLLEAEKSPPLFHRILDILQSKLPNVERHTVANASHGMHADNPQAFNNIVLDFLSYHFP
ncbi:MAG: hypothetical protein C4326_10545 [Ignavibacteria bacterium]